MENEFMNKEIEMTRKEPGFLRAAADSFLANLPILICGLIVALTLVREVF